MDGPGDRAGPARRAARALLASMLLAAAVVAIPELVSPLRPPPADLARQVAVARGVTLALLAAWALRGTFDLSEALGADVLARRSHRGAAATAVALCALLVLAAGLAPAVRAFDPRGALAWAPGLRAPLAAGLAASVLLALPPLLRRAGRHDLVEPATLGAAAGLLPVSAGLVAALAAATGTALPVGALARWFQLAALAGAAVLAVVLFGALRALLGNGSGPREIGAAG